MFTECAPCMRHRLDFSPFFLLVSLALNVVDCTQQDFPEWPAWRTKFMGHQDGRQSNQHRMTFLHLFFQFQAPVSLCCLVKALVTVRKKYMCIVGWNLRDASRENNTAWLPCYDVILDASLSVIKWRHN